MYVLAPSFPGYKDTEKNVLRYFSLPNPFVGSYPLGIPLVPLNKIKKIKPDIIHTQHPLVVGKFAEYVSDKFQLPLFFTAHTNYHQYLNYYFPKGYQITSRFITRDLRNIASKCRLVLCPSPETEERLNRLGITNTKTVYNGIDTNLFTPPKSLSADILTLIYTGRTVKEKNPELLIKIARHLSKITNFKMIIIGDGDLLSKMYQQVRRYKLEEKVLLTGNIKNEVLPNVYKSANIFITPSTSEVMPLSILEAQSCGLPVIALKKANLGSIVHHNQSGLLLDSNPKKIAEDVFALWKDKKRLALFSKNSVKIARAHSAGKNAEQLYKLYLEALR